MANYSTIDEYLADLPEDQRRALTTLRAQIRAAAPAAEEYVGYGLAGFKVHGRPLLYMGAAKNHCAIYGARADEALADKLKAFKQSKGTIQFTPDKPLPASVVKLIVKARLSALEERIASTKKAGAAKATKKKTKAGAAKSVTKKKKAVASAKLASAHCISAASTASLPR